MEGGGGGLAFGGGEEGWRGEEGWLTYCHPHLAACNFVSLACCSMVVMVSPLKLQDRR